MSEPTLKGRDVVRIGDGAVLYSVVLVLETYTCLRRLDAEIHRNKMRTVETSRLVLVEAAPVRAAEVRA